MKYFLAIIILLISLFYQIFPHQSSIYFLQVIKINLPLALVTYFYLFLNKNFLFFLSLVMGIFLDLMGSIFFFGFHQIVYLTIFFVNMQIQKKIFRFNWLIYCFFFVVNYLILSFFTMVNLFFLLEKFDLNNFIKISLLEIIYNIILSLIVYYLFFLIRRFFPNQNIRQ